MFAHVSIWGVLLGALSAMIVGSIWYSPVLFGKQWSKITGVTQKQMKAKMGAAMPVLIVVSLVTAYALSLVVAYLHSYEHDGWMRAGVEASLVAGIGFGVTTVFAHGVFEARSKVLNFINSGNRIVTLLVMGVIIALFK